MLTKLQYTKKYISYLMYFTYIISSYEVVTSLKTNKVKKK